MNETRQRSEIEEDTQHSSLASSEHVRAHTHIPHWGYNWNTVIPRMYLNKDRNVVQFDGPCDYNSKSSECWTTEHLNLSSAK